MSKSGYRIIGLMSGTSLDGLDIACCLFEQNNNTWNYKIEHAVTCRYNDEWGGKLATIHNASAYEFALANTEYGYYLAEKVNEFIAEKSITAIDLIASHGHTIFHQPEKNFTFQLGSGAAIAGRTGITTICDFRSTDVALNGQGAPLVPIGDTLLFPEFDYCLNLGGIANISFHSNGKRIAYDSCPVNLALNQLAQILGKKYDNEGELARSGSLNNTLLYNLNNLDFYKTTGAKSLGREWVEEFFFPLINSIEIPVQDKLNTVCEHIALQVAKSANTASAKMLVTGGGAYNRYLIERIKFHCKAEIIIPDKQTIEYKEALIFAFLGLLRFEQKNNTLATVTGASTNSSSGAIYWGKI
ncbi:MAG: Anhydro-N-acetylmuramic acid kinase [Bacteroidia bacterium]|nr:Anhydro-N-acetylmuramic acid kinase [Bacteroidia bacterium]